MHSFIRSTQLQSELHVALINRVCGHAASKQIQSEAVLHSQRSAATRVNTYLINRVCGHAVSKQILILYGHSLAALSCNQSYT
eukprot:COSAG05_NODE_389_length_10436_cov_116.442875_4_plen_83_part_00